MIVRKGFNLRSQLMEVMLSITGYKRSIERKNRFFAKILSFLSFNEDPPFRPSDGNELDLVSREGLGEEIKVFGP